MSYQFLTGNAGTGKSYTVKKMIADDSRSGLLAASTGIAGVNLGATTINAHLKYFDTASLRRAFWSNKLSRRLEDLAKNDILGRHLIIDEVSMLEAGQLDLIVKAFRGVFGDSRGIILTGDFAQLPPINGDFAFKAECWDEHFAPNVTRLTKVYRQSDPAFLEALNMLRRGDQLGAFQLFGCGARFESAVDPYFQGVTLVRTNAEADAINASRMSEIAAPIHIFGTVRKDEQNADWKHVPEAVILKVGARVMITANAQDFEYANGDIGIVTNLDQFGARIRLDRNGDIVFVGPVTRKNLDYDFVPPKYVGSITYMPIKSGWALTVHKAQGLTLPAVQLVATHQRIQDPSIVYVACSRVSDASHLRIVGTVDELAKKTNAHPEVGEWL